MDPDSESLITLKKAALLLNVHPATLRRWADNGDILVVLTPGGHRRFPRSEVERMARFGKQTAPTDDAVSYRLEKNALEHTRAGIAEHQDETWMQSMSEDLRREQRDMGRKVMGLMMQYVSVQDEATDMLEEARSIGQTYAEMAKKTGLSLSQTIQAMMFFRENIVESLVVLPESVQQRTNDSQYLLRRVNTFLNAILMGATEIYESAK